MQENLQENLLLESNIETFKTIAEESPNMIFINYRGRVVYANTQAEKVMGYSKKEFYSKSFNFTKLIAPESMQVVKKAYLSHQQNKEIPPYEYLLKTKSGKKIEVIITTKLINIKGGQPAILGIITDISRQKAVERALRNSEENYRTIINSLADAIHVVDRNLRIVFISKTFRIWLKGFKLRQDIDGKTIFEAFRFLSQKVKKEYRKVFRTGKMLVTQETTVIGRRQIHTETRKIPVFKNKKVVNVITVMRDITSTKITEQELNTLNKGLIKSNKKLERLTFLDSHTGLYNHRFLNQVLDSEFAVAKKENKPLSLLMLDLDYFKSINDVYGHSFGDMLLRKFAQELKKLVRKNDVIFRYGGEEFMVVLPNTNAESAKKLAQRILDEVNLKNFGNKKTIIKLKLSIAISTYPQDRIFNVADMIEVADKILNKVKEYGGNRVFSYEDLSAGKTKDKKLSSEKLPDGVGYLKEKMVRLHKRANQSLIEAVFAFAKTIELKDRYTGEHVERTVHYATEIAKRLNMSKEEIMTIKQAAILHDLGKVGISEKILLKRARLTSKEFEEIKEHPFIGADIIRPIHMLHDIIPLIMYHHERWDGKGYPMGLKGEEIPLGARIISIADAYQALISNRPYRKAFPKKKAIKIIENSAGTHFDPAVVAAFVDVINKIHK